MANAARAYAFGFTWGAAGKLYIGPTEPEASSRSPEHNLVAWLCRRKGPAPAAPVGCGIVLP